jgi:chromosome segregation ATPase
MAEEDGITMTMSEFGKFQNDILKIKHENARLKAAAEKYEELLKLTQNPLSDIQRFHNDPERTTSPDSKEAKTPFNRDALISCLKIVRKQESFAEAEELMVEQMVTIAEHMWKSGGPSGEGDRDMAIEIATLRTETKKASDEAARAKLDKERLETKTKHLEAAVDSVSIENESFRSRLQELTQQKEQLITDLAMKEEELRESRNAQKEKFAVECAKHEAELERDRLRTVVSRLEAEVKDLTGEGSVKTRISSLEKANRDLTDSLESLKKTLRSVTLDCETNQTAAKQAFEDLQKSQSSLRDLKSDLDDMQAKYQSMSQELEDARTEKQIVQKRSMNDLRDLKTELAKEKTAHEHSKMEVEKMKHEVRRLHDLQQNYIRGRGEAATLGEKVFVEELSNRVGELERELEEMRKNEEESADLKQELEAERREKEELAQDVVRLQTNLGELGAQLNEMMRRGQLRVD